MNVVCASWGTGQLLTYIMVQSVKPNWQANQRKDRIKPLVNRAYRITAFSINHTIIQTQWTTKLTYLFSQWCPMNVVWTKCLLFSHTKQLFMVIFQTLLFYFVVGVLSGNVFSQYQMEASKVVTLCWLPSMPIFITVWHQAPGRDKENWKAWWKTALRIQ